MSNDNYQSAPQTALKPLERGKIIAVANQKGGVGKTTTTINLATALAAVNKRVLVVDLDPQGNASTGLGIMRSMRDNGSYELIFEGRALSDVIQSTKVPGLKIIAASMNLSGAEIELVSIEGREYRLRDPLRSAAFNYDYILIDCPPALGLLTLNALVAADSVIVPLQTEFYALEGLSHLVRTLERVKKSLNPKLDLDGVVLTMFDKRNSLSDMVAADVRGHFKDKVFNTVIPRNVRVSEAPSHGLPVMLYDMKCSGSMAYIHLAREILQREAAGNPPVSEAA